MQAYIFLFHGFNDRKAGADNVDTLAAPLVEFGHIVEKDDTVDYGWRGLIGVRLFRYDAIARIADAILAANEKGLPLVGIAYSNGANYLFAALRLLFGVRMRVILIHPALPPRVEVPAGVERGWVFITRSDFAVRAAVLVRWLVPGWGAMGVTGYRGDDPRLQNTVDVSDVARGHGGAFKPHCRKLIVREIQRIISLPWSEDAKP